VLEIHDIHKTFNGGTAHEVRALQGVSATIEDGSFTVVIGTNGSGKSSLLNAVAGTFTVDRGRLRIAGQDVTLWPEFRRASLVGRVFQNPFSGTAPGLTIAENLALAAKRGQPRGLGPAISVRLRRQMREEIHDLQQRLQLTVVYVTHDQAEAMAVSDRIIVMDRAVIAQEGAPRELYEQPRDSFVAGFMGDANRVRGTLARRDATHGDVRLGPVTLVLPHRGLADGDCEVAIRPEGIELRHDGDAPIAATVRKAAYLGQLMEYTLDTTIGDLFVISTAVDRPLPVGGRVGVALANHGVVVIPPSSPATGAPDS